MPNNISKPFYEQTISNNYNLNNIINKIKINEKISYQEIKSLIKKILGRYYFRYFSLSYDIKGVFSNGTIK